MATRVLVVAALLCTIAPSMAQAAGLRIDCLLARPVHDPSSVECVHPPDQRRVWQQLARLQLLYEQRAHWKMSEDA